MKKLKRPRFLKSNFKVSERLRFQRKVLLLIAVAVVLISGPVGIWFKSTHVSDYSVAVKRKAALNLIFTDDGGAGETTDTATRYNNLQEHFQLEEKIHAGLIEGTEKLVYYPANFSKVTLAEMGLIYFHGFMATRLEISPVVERTADETGHPVFFSRVAQHGIAGSDLRNLSMKDYIESIAEAEVVATQLAKKVVLVGVSTGAPMAMLMAADENPDAPERFRKQPVVTQALTEPDESFDIANVTTKKPKVTPVAGLVLIAPNFGLPRWDWRLMTGPLGSLLGRIFLGSHYEWTPQNQDQSRYWTHRVHTDAVRAMTEIVQLGMRAGTERLDWSSVSVLLVQNPNDKVVDNSAAHEYLKQFNFKSLEVLQMPAADHVLAGRIMSPQNTDALVKAIGEFIRRIQ